MTTLPQQDRIIPRGPQARPRPAGRRFWPGFWRGYDYLVVLAALAALIADRVYLCRKFLFAYTDHDQTLLWAAAHEVLHGHFREPCFYGQAYNSYLESILAAPLIYFSMPYPMALPLVTVTLSLLPFVALAALAHMRKQTLAAWVILCIPLCMPAQYGIEAGITRGFVTGLAVATVPMILLLRIRARRARRMLMSYEDLLNEPPPNPPKDQQQDGIVRRSWRWGLRTLRPKESLSFFFAATFAMLAVIINPNAGLLMLALYVMVYLAHHQNWRFWLFTSAGFAAGYAWQMYITYFYNVANPDYLLHMKNRRWPWSTQYFDRAMNKLQDFFSVYLPVDNAGMILLYVGVGLIALLLIMKQFRAATAGLVTMGFTLATLGYARVHDGGGSLFLSLSRHYLAIPVVAALLVLFVDRGLGRHNWLRRMLVALTIPLVVIALNWKYQQMPGVFEDARKKTGPLQVMSTEDVNKQAAQYQKMLADEKTDMIVFQNNALMAYALPGLINCRAMTPDYERRTWLMHEESQPLRERILICTGDNRVLNNARKMDPKWRMVSDNPKVISLDTGGRSTIDILRTLGMRMRNFTPPVIINSATPASQPAIAVPATMPAVISTAPTTTQAASRPAQ